jgi:hypothetical protein
MKTKLKDYKASPEITVFEEPRWDADSARSYFVTEADFTPSNDNDHPPPDSSAGGDPYLLVGIDTEFKGPSGPITRDDVKAGAAKFTVLSYQFHCEASSGESWSSIHCPQNGERISLAEFLVFALAKGVRDGKIACLPKKIYLVGHFTRADIPAFSDFKSLTDFLSSVRNTFITIDRYIPLDIQFPGKPIRIKVYLRDTMLLSPSGAKSLAALGELVGVPKVTLNQCPKEELRLKQNMDELRANDWQLFRRYAMTDAVICVEYLKSILNQYRALVQKPGVPATLTSIGVDVLWNIWQQEGFEPLDLLGKEQVEESRYDRKKGWYVNEIRVVPLREVYWQLAFVTECYHGGRNEQFWFGPSYNADWTDYDLSSAYPTAMALIGEPRWLEMDRNPTLDDFGPTTLGFACVEFAWPDSIRYPTLPVRTDNGLIFPRTGITCCASPEIWQAKALGAELSLKHGLIVPTGDEKIFAPFTKFCLEQRAKHEKKSVSALFWKELANSTYGKTAQGLMKKRVYDMRERNTRPLPPSRITNPFFAAFITSFVRAVLGEIMNAIEPSSMVFSCTTDGFLTDAPANQIEMAQSGSLASIYRQTRQDLTGVPSVLEIKHRVKRLLGWKTRGQATLVPGNGIDNVVLAKSSIKTDQELDTVEAQNAYVTDLFFNREPNQQVHISSLTGIRDILDADADLVEKSFTRRLNMEYDFKRRPTAIGSSRDPAHLVFDTKPWDHFDEFRNFRFLADEFQSSDPVCLKTETDLFDLLEFVEIRLPLSKSMRSYLKRRSNGADLDRLRLLLCSAWKQSMAGFKQSDLKLSSQQFATALTESGIACKRHNVEYGKRRTFKPNTCPATNRCRTALERLKSAFPNLQVEVLLAKEKHAPLKLEAVGENPFVARVTSQ